MVGAVRLRRSARAVRPGLRRRPGPGDDLFALLAAADAAALPPLHVSCGTEDQLLPMNRRFAAEAEAAGAEVTTDFRPGEHEWGLWDAVIREVIDWLPRGG